MINNEHATHLRKRAEFSDDLNRLFNDYPSIDLEIMMSDAEAVLAARRSETQDEDILNLESRIDQS